jgi:REP element-mobilizing transposase RayT
LLPHWQAAHAVYFLTFRVLSGTLSPPERDIVLRSCLHWHGSRVVILAAIVMPDHAHLIMRPLVREDGTYPSVPWFVQSVKGYSARMIQSRRGASGSLWQDEYWDRIMRSEREFDDTIEYLLLNSVRRGLCTKWREYPYVFHENDPSGVIKSHMTTRRGLKDPAPTILHIARGEFLGRIGVPPDIPRGSHGFGYDPLFLVGPEFTRTSAELLPKEKNAVSHRALAAKTMARWLRDGLS